MYVLANALHSVVAGNTLVLPQEALPFMAYIFRVRGVLHKFEAATDGATLEAGVKSFVGSAIAPGSQSIYRLIVAQILIGAGFANVPLAYCVPSEILPRKSRPSKYTLPKQRCRFKS